MHEVAARGCQRTLTAPFGWLRHTRRALNIDPGFLCYPHRGSGDGSTQDERAGTLEGATCYEES